MQNLNHPNIIRCYDYFIDGKDNSKLYAVFEYCGKGTLKEYTEGQKEEKVKILEE